MIEDTMCERCGEKDAEICTDCFLEERKGLCTCCEKKIAVLCNSCADLVAEVEKEHNVRLKEELEHQKRRFEDMKERSHNDLDKAYAEERRARGDSEHHRGALEKAEMEIARLCGQIAVLRRLCSDIEGSEMYDNMDEPLITVNELREIVGKERGSADGNEME